MATCCPTSKAPKWNLRRIKLNTKTPVPKDYEIARSVTGKYIEELCQEVGIDKYEFYGKYKAKVTRILPKSSDNDVGPNVKRGKYVVVTSITPTQMGEGKSTTTLGLAQALSAHLSKNCIACIRQPSQGPTFGMKGGAAGGGYSQVWPMDDFNLHLTGDIHAVTAANNLIAAAIDARILHESNQTTDDLFRRLIQTKDGSKFTQAQKRLLSKINFPENYEPDLMTLEQKHQFARLDLDPNNLTVTRVIDTNDRFLRAITIGQSATEKFQARQTKFSISVASELMAILALSNDMEDFCDRVNRMVVGYDKSSQRAITCDDLCVSGAVCALLKDAIYPTLMQTLEGSPVLVHCGPFANIAHGNSSIIADRLALDLVGPEGFVITEAGFGSDVGFEKFMDIKCRSSGLMPDCAVLVATVKALKWHGQQQQQQQGDRVQNKHDSDMETLKAGLVNLEAHIRNIQENFHVPVLVALNRFSNDTQAELDLVAEAALKAGASGCRVCDNWARGGEGAKELGEALINLCEEPRCNVVPRLLYSNDQEGGLLEKIKLVAQRVYLAKDIKLGDEVLAKILSLERLGFGHLPVCIAKTQMSISHEPKWLGVPPKDYTFPIESVEVSAGAGFVYALAGEISTMPGLPTRPAFFDITFDPKTGQVDGLF